MKQAQGENAERDKSSGVCAYELIGCNVEGRTRIVRESRYHQVDFSVVNLKTVFGITGESGLDLVDGYCFGKAKDVRLAWIFINSTLTNQISTLKKSDSWSKPVASFIRIDAAIPA